MKEEEEKEGKKTIDIGKEAAIEAEVRAARERAIVPLETRIKSFKDMLAEKDVNTHTHTSYMIYISRIVLSYACYIVFSSCGILRYLHLARGRKSFIR